jgi:HSP20 family molecular chaperone IbpA
MKTYYLKNHARVLTTGLISLGLGVAGITGLAAAPSDSNPNNTPSQSDAVTANNNGNAPANNNNAQSWEHQFNDRMQHIQKEMDDLVRDSMSSMDLTGGAFAGWPKFDASATVQDHGNAYVATFDLPKRDLSNVKVAVRDGILSVKASAETEQPVANTVSSSKNSKAPQDENVMLNEYEQLVTLPGPVDSSKVKVDKHGDSITVTIPKKDVKATAEK